MSFLAMNSSAGDPTISGPVGQALTPKWDALLGEGFSGGEVSIELTSQYEVFPGFTQCLRDIHEKNGQDAVPFISKLMGELVNNKWAVTESTVLYSLLTLLTLSMRHPDAVWQVIF